MVHHLQEHIEDRRVCLFYFIKQQHRVWLFGDGFGQQTTLVKADIARRCANQTADSVLLHVFAHVKTKQLDAHDVGKLLSRFGLANARGSAEQERADWLVTLTQARASHFDGRGQHI